MLKSFEYEGIWWLPDKPEEQVEGVLKFDPSKGTRLELNNLLRKNSELEIMKIKNAPIILGFSLSGRDFTLLNCYNPFAVDFIPVEFFIDYIFEGGPF